MEFDKLLKLVVEKGASDLFITAGMPPCIKLNGQMVPVTKGALSPEQSREIVLSVMNEDLQHEFMKSHECNFAINTRGLGRFRVSAFYQRNLVGMVLRRIEVNIPSINELGLPDIVGDLAMTRNQNSRGHIISIEDPIEFIHQHKGCIVTQREVGVDTESFEIALKNTLRQAPDVIMIGEVRSRETMEYALTFSETGHLCLCTLHANNANQAIDRMIHFFPADRHSQVWMDLSLNLRAIVAQQLIPTKDGNGRRVAVEVMLNTPLASDHIRKGEVHLLKDLMTRSTEQGMQTFDQALYKLYAEGEISYEAALAHADSPNDLRLMIKLGADSDPNLLQKVDKGLSLQDREDQRWGL
ncbi:MAG: ATPase, T2SS/T4P/T4SS family [Gammaproteobacteria bacterium]